MSIEQIVASVQSFNNLAGNPAGCGLEPSNSSAAMYDTLILEEIDETRSAFEELLDGCADIVVVALGKLHVTDSINLKKLVQSSLELSDTPKEELLNLLDASEDINLRTLQPEPVSIIKSALQLCERLGVDSMDVLEEVCEANMSKFCSTIEEADASVKAYEDDPRYTNVHFKYREDEELFVILGNKVDASSDQFKILKGINTFKPNISKFLLS